MKRLLTITLLSFALTFCKKEHAPDCLTPNGNDVTVLRETGSFYAVELNSNITLHIIKGSTSKVEVTGGEYLLDKVTTAVTNGTLIINNDNRCNFVRGYKHHIEVKITVPYLSGVINNGVNDIIFDAGFHQDSTLYLNAGNSGDIRINGEFKKIVTSSHGNGDLYFNGKATHLNVYCNGTNFTYAEHLEVSDYIFISTYSLGDVYVNLLSGTRLDYYIMKDGNIYYRGNSTSINQLSDGSAKGRLIKEN